MDGNDGIVWYLRASEQDDGAGRVLVVEGRVSSASAGSLAEFLTALSGPGQRALVVDLSGVDYINGAGLQVFEAAARRIGEAGGELVVCGLRPVVRTAFDLAGPIPHLAIESSREAAVRLAGT